jgi:Regulated-SNARE-like domain
MAIASDKMVFYYMARDNLCFLTLCEEAYPKRLAFLYLEEIADIILQELLREYGSNVSVFLVVRLCVKRVAEVRRHYPEHELLS